MSVLREVDQRDKEKQRGGEGEGGKEISTHIHAETRDNEIRTRNEFLH